MQKQIGEIEQKRTELAQQRNEKKFEKKCSKNKIHKDIGNVIYNNVIL